MKKKAAIQVVLVLLMGIFVGYRYIYKKHRDITCETVAFSLSVPKLQQDFLENDSLANAKYADQTIEIYGKISGVDLLGNTITIDKKVLAILQYTLAIEPQLQQRVRVKGRFVGYDDLLEEFKMDQVTLLR